MRGFTHDLALALRHVWRTPGSAAVVILTLSLGLAVSTVTFHFADAVLFRPLPFPNAHASH